MSVTSQASSISSSSLASTISPSTLVRLSIFTIIHITAFLNQYDEIQLELTNRTHHALLHYGFASASSSTSSLSASSSSSSSSQLRQAHSHHRRIRVDAIIHSLTLYCGPTSAASSSSFSFSSSSSESLSVAAFLSTRQLHFWNRGPGMRQIAPGYIHIDNNADYDCMRPEWLIPTQCGVLITRDMIACQSQPEAKLRTPINVVGIGLAVEEQVEQQKPVLASARQSTAARDANGDDTSGSGHAFGIPNASSSGYRNAIAQLRRHQQQQEQSNTTLGEVGAQLAQKAAAAYETEMREALTNWNSSELRYLLYALDQCAILRAAIDAESAEWDFQLPNPDPTGRYKSDMNEQVEITPAFIRVKADFDTLRKPMFVLCPWSSPLPGSRDDMRPPDAPSRVQGLIDSYDAEMWSEESLAYKDWQSFYPDEPRSSPPFYPPLPPERIRSDEIEATGGVDVESPDLRLAQLTTLLHECPWPFLTEAESYFYQRLPR